MIMNNPPLRKIILFSISILCFSIGCKKEFEVYEEAEIEVSGTYSGNTRQAVEIQSGSSQPFLHSDTTYRDTIIINKINQNSIEIKYVGDKVFNTFSDDKFDYSFVYSSWTYFNAKFNKLDSVVISGRQGNGSSSGYQITHYEFKGKKI